MTKRLSKVEKAQRRLDRSIATYNRLWENGAPESRLRPLASRSEDLYDALVRAQQEQGIEWDPDHPSEAAARALITRYEQE